MISLKWEKGKQPAHNYQLTFTLHLGISIPTNPKQ